ncbi:MAG TPA: polysaccharide deacetylase family protein [Nitrospira sp.]|nr:polysaccharide deacetylase family protein [Nitrospira sp.]
MAFFAGWDMNSLISLKANAERLDVVLPLWFHLGDARGNVTHDDQAAEQRVLQWILGKAPHLRVLPVVDNYSVVQHGWNADAAERLLSSAEAQNRFIDQLLEATTHPNIDGIVMDFEGLSAAGTHNLVQFVGLISARLHSLGRKLYVSIPAYSEGYDLEALVAAADRVIILNYDEYGEADVPGPLASQGWFEERLDHFFQNVDDEKIVVGIGSFAYDWRPEHRGREISITQFWNLLRGSSAEFFFDGDSLNPTFRYRDQKRDEIHEVWALDAVTVFNQVASALAMRPGGLALRRLGTEDPGTWTVFGRGNIPDAKALEALKLPDAGTQISYQGKGEVLRVTTRNKPGRRNLEFDPAFDLITEEEIRAIPAPFAITRWGYRNKVVALTFDDGPSEVYTPKILEILAQESVKATFFVIGSNAALRPDLVRRIYAEGHDIGNHTFTHPNISLLSPGQLKLELTGTQRTIESIVGVRTNLFRPPYAQDVEPETLDQATSLIRSDELGYTTVGQSIDPMDWSRPGADEIVARTIHQVTQNAGNVVLLHDGGGDRSQTQAALPRIIRELKARGYVFSTIHELISLPRAKIMPSTPPNDSVTIAFTHLALGLYRVASNLIQLLFLAGIALGALRVILIGAGALVHSRRRQKRRADSKWMPQKFAVIIPAYNEEKVICKAVWALLSIPQTDFEIIVVDDGSTDRTSEALIASFSDNPRVRVLRKRNGGKATALRLGLKETHAEFIVTQDADTVFAQYALPLLLRHFADPQVGAVAGAAVVGNTVNWLTRFQWMEYITSQNMDRRALELVNAITVVPGAIGAWRRSALLAAGGFVGDTLAEDADATLRIELAGWRVVSENKAIAQTEAPETVGAFWKQRFRWMFGTLQAVFKHRLAYLQRGGWGLKLVGLPNILVFQFFFTLVSPVMDLLLLWSILAGIWIYSMHPGAELPVWYVLPYWIGFQVLEIATLALAFLLDGRRGWWRAVPLLLAQRFYYRQLLYCVALRCLIAVLHGHLVSWNKLKRTGRVGPVGEPIKPIPALQSITSGPAFETQVRRPSPRGLRMAGFDRALIFERAHALSERERFRAGYLRLFGRPVKVKSFSYCLKVTWEDARRDRARKATWAKLLVIPKRA